MSRVGFVGLGVMGGPMASHVLSGGFELVVWNRSPEKTEALARRRVEVAPDLETLGATCSQVFLCVTRTEDVRECLDALVVRARPGTLFVDHSTISPTGAIAIHEDLASKGFAFVDAPITGGSAGAQRGALTIFCGGSEVDVRAAMPVLNTYSRRAERVGGPGAGQMMKMANQIAVGGALLGLCESLSFAAKAGLDVKQAHELIGSGAAGSWAFEHYGPMILAEDWRPGFSVANQRKDFGYVIEAAEAVDAATPGTATVDRLLKRLADEGHGDWTTAGLFDAMKRMGFHE